MIQYIWSTYIRSFDVYQGAGRADVVMGDLIQNCTEMMNSQKILPVPSIDLISLPASLRSAKGFVCVSTSLATVPLGCAGPCRHRWQAAVCDRPSHLAMITFSSFLSSLPSLHYEPVTPPFPPPKWRRLTYLAVSLLIQKTSKQMTSSPVQRCRPAAHASCQETPHTCWLCTFPEKQRQM